MKTKELAARSVNAYNFEQSMRRSQWMLIMWLRQFVNEFNQKKCAARGALEYHMTDGKIIQRAPLKMTCLRCAMLIILPSGSRCLVQSSADSGSLLVT